jgi:lysine-N-methylase
MATLHPTRRIQALVPLYSQRFACIGSECEDTCCAGWRVTIDKTTYAAYKKSKNPQLSERLDNKVKRVRSQASDANYARMELDPGTGICPMVEDHLCSIQKELGEDKLSNTCFSYPRVSTEIGGIYQQALTLSCPEAARLALLADDAMEFTQSELSIRSETIEKQKPFRGLSLDQMNEVRFFCIQLLKMPDLLLWQKLALLGLFCETLTENLKNGGKNKVSNIIESLRGVIEGNQFADLFESMQPHYEIQAITFALLWKVKHTAPISEHQQKVHHSVAKGLGADIHSGQVEEAQLINQYKLGVKQLPEALKDAPYFLQNYVLNEMFRENFPFGQDSPYEHYLRLITRFGLVRFMLASQCANEKELPTLNDLTQTVQSFCRRFQHDGQFAVNVNNCFNNSGWSDLQKIYRFLKT